MASTNITGPQTSDSCTVMGSFAWKDEYLTNAEYINLVISACINSISFPITTILNGLVIFFIIRRPMLRRKKCTVVIGYQAVTDLAVGIVVQPTFLATQLCRITGGCRICKLDSIFYYLAIVTCASSIDHLLLISCERYIAIKHTLRYRSVVTANRLLAATMTAWLVEITWHGLFFFGRINSFYIYDIIQLIAIIIYISIIVYSYTAIYLESRRHLAFICTFTLQQQTNRSKEFKAAKTTALVLGCLLTCYAPTCVSITVKSILPMNSSYGPVWECILAWTVTFALLNSLMNPLIYGWRVQDIRKVVASTFKLNENNLRQDLRTNRIEKTENRNRNVVNLRPVRAVEDVSGAFADNPRRPRTRGNETGLKTETCTGSNTEQRTAVKMPKKTQIQKVTMNRTANVPRKEMRVKKSNKK